MWPSANFSSARHRSVDLRIAQFGSGRDHFRCRTAEGADHVDGITTGVHQSATGKRVVVANVGELRQREAQRRLDPSEFAQRAGGEDLLGSQSQRMVAVMERLHYHSVRLRGHVGDLAGLDCVGGERLLAQHVLAGVECGAGPFAVQSVRKRVVDRIQVGIGDQGLVAVVHARDLVFGSKCPSAGAVARGHRAHHNVRVALRRFDERRWGDASCAQDADS